MKQEIFDKKVKESLLEGTKYPENMNDDIWNKIEKELTVEQNINNPARVMKTKKKAIVKIGMVASIAATIFLALMITTTETGSAFIDQIRQLFDPEKTVTEEIEGIESDSSVSLHEGKAGYVIYFDKEKYSMIEVDGKDRIVFDQELPEMYPEVFMEISQQSDHPESLAQNMYEQLKEEYSTVLAVERVEKPLQGFVVYAVGKTGGNEWNDPVIRYYFFNNENGGSFVVKQKYFIEAEEGHGARFDLMLEQFYMYDQSDN